MTQKNLFFAGVALIVLGAMFLMRPSDTDANHAVYAQACQTNDFGTTSLNVITAGTGTTTLPCNLGVDGANEATILIQQGGASPLSTLRMDVQYSQDGIDWYAASGGWNIEEGTASTSPSIGDVQSYTLTFASSTINRSVVTNANSATTTRAVRVRVPTKWVRAVFYAPVGATQSLLWAQIIPRTEI